MHVYTKQTLTSVQHHIAMKIHYSYNILKMNSVKSNEMVFFLN